MSLLIAAPFAVAGFAVMLTAAYRADRMPAASLRTAWRHMCADTVDRLSGETPPNNRRTPR